MRSQKFTSVDTVEVGVFRVDLEIREDNKARRFRVQRNAEVGGAQMMCHFKDELEDLADAVDEMIARVESKEQRARHG